VIECHSCRKSRKGLKFNASTKHLRPSLHSALRSTLMISFHLLASSISLTQRISKLNVRTISRVLFSPWQVPWRSELKTTVNNIILFWNNLVNEIYNFVVLKLRSLNFMTSGKTIDQVRYTELNFLGPSLLKVATWEASQETPLFMEPGFITVLRRACCRVLSRMR
jgi:hypothetical protein